MHHHILPVDEWEGLLLYEYVHCFLGGKSCVVYLSEHFDMCWQEMQGFPQTMVPSPLVLSNVGLTKNKKTSPQHRCKKPLLCRVTLDTILLQMFNFVKMSYNTTQTVRTAFPGTNVILLCYCLQCDVKYHHLWTKSNQQAKNQNTPCDHWWTNSWTHNTSNSKSKYTAFIENSNFLMLVSSVLEEEDVFSHKEKGCPYRNTLGLFRPNRNHSWRLDRDAFKCPLRNIICCVRNIRNCSFSQVLAERRHGSKEAMLQLLTPISDISCSYYSEL